MGVKQGPFQTSIWAILGLGQVSSVSTISQSSNVQVSYATSTDQKKDQPTSNEKGQEEFQKSQPRKPDREVKSGKPNLLWNLKHENNPPWSELQTPHQEVRNQSNFSIDAP